MNMFDHSLKQETKQLLTLTGGDAYLLVDQWKIHKNLLGLPSYDHNMTDRTARAKVRDALNYMVQQLILDPVPINSVKSSNLMSILSPPGDSPDPYRFLIDDMIILNGIIEIFGSPGAGKTQFALTLLARSLLHSCTSHDDIMTQYIWIDLEGTFSPHRLKDIIRAGLVKYDSIDKNKIDQMCLNILSKVEVFSHSYGTIKDVNQYLLKYKDNDVNIMNYRLIIVIDSVGSGARRLDHLNRRNELHTFTMLLSELQSRSPHSNIIVLNQVTTYFSNQPGFYYNRICKELSLPSPALGLSWAQTVNTRIGLQKIGDNEVHKEGFSIPKGRFNCSWCRIYFIHSSTINPMNNYIGRISYDGFNILSNSSHVTIIN